MGILDNIKNIFKKENKDIRKTEIIDEEKQPRNKITTKNGIVEVECFEPVADSRKNDTTVVYINPTPYTVERSTLYNCKVAWTKDSYTVMFDEDEYYVLGYKDVLASIDLYKLQTDEEYRREFVRQAMGEEHVKKYLNMGLEESPEVPCGNYIGGIRKKEDGRYRKFLDPRIGAAVHNSKSMVNKRNEYRQNQKRQSQIRARNAERRKEIARLQQEIEGEYK